MIYFQKTIEFMELKISRILGHFLVVSLALNAGLLYRDYCNGAHSPRVDGFDFKNLSSKALLGDVIDALTCKNDSLAAINRAPLENDEVIDLDHGDPTMYERYWQQIGDRTTVVISGWKLISYFSDRKKLCWFMEPEFENAVTRLHRLVGNAVTEDRHIVVGTGSTQLFQAVLYAVSSPNASEPINVVSAAPFYSMYPLITDLLKSGLYKWAGDAHKYRKDEPYIELVTSPNNPDGSSRQAVVNSNKGILIHDLAYYWPQHTPISSPPLDHDIMLFTQSKLTGHAGARLGWAIVKNEEIARKMTEYIVISSIGVSKESQIRAAKILQVLADTHEHKGHDNIRESDEAFFDHSYDLMAKRWRQLRDAVKKSKLFSLPEFPQGTCAFSGRTFATQPAFAWLKCEVETEDCERFLGAHNILTRSGKHFGESSKYVRISVLPRHHLFDQFIQRLATINST